MADDDLIPAATPLDEWLDRLAEGHGAPGGGAACAVMTGISAALLGMVAAYTPDEPEAARARERVGRIRRQATGAAEADGVRSAEFGAALAMEDGPERERAVRAATVEATESSLAVGRVAASLVDEVRLLAEIGNPNVRADLLVAGQALAAALGGIVATTRADLELLAGHRTSGDGLDDALGRAEGELREIADVRGELARMLARLGPRG
ncbi:cyclodeaminase/cyclohydrolase family protein [Microbacterium yannicii]|uniref:cyclodeaminase/cyclohydrolase family protein n=1 Tax=Microbacterium yannicii TaxID=671622 RepID=UPI00030FC3B1|nr:cyclodeaminase/cyclohydrolase family protein [Microbacterium yannicii]